MTMRIVPALSEQAAQLVEIALAAKGSWGYPAHLLAGWAATPIISADDIARDSVWIALSDMEIQGWMRLLWPEPAVAQLEDLWVIPAAMGKGVGRSLFAYAVELAGERQAHRLLIESDPNAQGFYEKMGAVVTGSVRSSWGRMVPVLTLDLRGDSA